MAMREIPLPGAAIGFDPDWLAAGEADRLYDALLRSVPWEVHRIRLFGREAASPRLSCWIGDPSARYRYSGTLFEPRPWPPVLLPVRERLDAELGAAFNSVLANRYRDGNDAMGWHRDAEPELGPRPPIASLSLGAGRRFVLRGDGAGAPRLSLDLGHGSLLVMRGDTQANYRHAVPRTAKAVGERINLTFRRIIL